MKSGSVTRQPVVMPAGKSESIKVVVRCRPLSQQEQVEGHLRVVDVNCERGTVQLSKSPLPLNNSLTNSATSASPSGNDVKIYTFDSVYDWNSTQEEIYADIFHPLVDSVLEGFNGTIFAYGQTGTGKTFTMEGCGEDPGVIPRSFLHIFSHIGRSSQKQFLVRSSYLEIYQEEIRDLLSTDVNKRLELRERPEVGVYVKDLSSFVCKNVHEIERVLAKGRQNRAVGATNMNEHSSRSHAIFVITVEHSETDGAGIEHIRVGKLNMVDLAGSERQAKTKTVGQRQKEAIKINLSLSALGNVISALVDGRSTHIPYRDSKLTRILQDSLGGNARTVMVANIGPADYNYEETLITLRYANRAKNIKNKPKVNEDPKDTLLKEFQAEIERLRVQLEERRRQKVNAVMSESGEQIDVEATEKLQSRIRAMESKMLVGGKNIVDHTNEQQYHLEQRMAELREQKQRERAMLQQLEEHEEATQEVRETFTSLQQEVEMKRRKLRKVVKELQSVNSEIRDLHDSHAEERRELERISSDLMRDLKLRYLIIDNFIPEYEKTRFLRRVYYDENNEEWCYRPNSTDLMAISTSDENCDPSGKIRPDTASSRPNSSYNVLRASVSSNALNSGSGKHATMFPVPFYFGKPDELGLYMPEPTTLSYEPKIEFSSDDEDDCGVQIEICDQGETRNTAVRPRTATSSKRRSRQHFSQTTLANWNDPVTAVGKTPPPMRRSLTVMNHYPGELESDQDWLDTTDLKSLDTDDINGMLDAKRANIRRTLILAKSNQMEKQKNLNQRPDTAFPRSRGLVPK